MKKNLILLSIVLLCVFVSTILKAQQDGDLDLNFGTAGRVSIYASGSSQGDNLYSVIVLPNGRIVYGGYANYAGIAGRGDLYIGKMTSKGMPDTTFGTGGFITNALLGNYSDVRDMALMNDGSIVYGGTSTSGTSKGAMMGRLAADGSSIVTPTTTKYISTTINNEPTCMASNSAANKVAIGGYYYSTVSYMFAHNYNLDGTANTGFSGDGTVFFGDAPTQNVTYTKAISMLIDGSVLLGGSSSSGAVSLVKLRSDGSLDATFGSATPPTGIELYGLGSPPNGGIEGMLVLPSGKIMVCGTTNNNFFIGRFNANGTYDNTFPIATYSYGTTGPESFNSMLLQPDGKIIASGTSVYGSSYGVIARYNTNGTIDTTFGTMGVVVLPNMEINSSAISVIDKSAVFAGKFGTQMTLVKIKYEVQQYNIIGKDIVSVETENNYIAHPTVTGYTYNWSYSSPNIYTLGSSTNDTLTLYFTKTTPSGTLTCVVKNLAGATVKTITKSITVNQEPTLAELLEDVQCEAVQTNAKDNYINSFMFRQTKLKSTNTGASPSGYSDFTASANYDTLYTGDNYQATVESVLSTKGVMYCGIWIDFNNNGKMEDANEFVGSAASSSATFNVNNIVIPANLEAGPKRVRVRVRPAAPFNSYESCMPNEELSETEDYLIVITSYTGVEAPNFITPNNDGKNDNFVVRGVKTDINNNLKIFNKIGDLVYDKDNYDNTWSGFDNSGGRLKSGTYYYVFTQPNAEKGKDDIVKGFFEIRY